MKLSFHERRPAVAQVSAWFSFTRENQERFGKTSSELCRRTAGREHQAHLGMLQMHVQRAMFDEGMTSEVGLCACATFDDITSTSTHASILLFSDMTDGGGFRADFDHMINLLRRVASEQGYDFKWHLSYTNDKHKEALAYFVGAANV